MHLKTEQNLLGVINATIKPLAKTADYSSLIENIGNARFVMMGEASHGTHEFYQTRIDLTKKLIMEKGFMAVAVEGDWPDVYRLHSYIQGKDDAGKWQEAFAQFTRFPTWMWSNTTMAPFIKWLRNYNDNLVAKYKVGIFGLDLYSLNASMQAVIKYLMKIDPAAAEDAKNRYACFDHMNVDPQMYGYLTKNKVKKSCIEEVIEEFREMQHRASKYVCEHDSAAADEYFFATQNARIVKNAEEYYRSMFSGHISSWNIRDRHMSETLNILVDYLEHNFNKPAKIVIWAHNSHIGDARATEMGEKGEVNIGQLIREQHIDTYSIGFSTYDGFVTAASNWDEPAECKKIVPGLKGSYEELFHEVKAKNFILNLAGNEQIEHYLKIPRLQRAIGVIYRPETERQSHYFFTHLPYQFDSIIHFDNTTAVQPLN